MAEELLFIDENIKAVKANIKKACQRVGRDEQEVTLIAVSKTKPVTMIEAANRFGQYHFGENKVQELTAKYDCLGNTVEWHMIGHLQRNKVKDIVAKVALIHSVDSLRLAQQIEKEAAKIDRVIDILLEVNVAGEASKYGFTFAEAKEACAIIGKFSHVRIRGFMTVAPYTEESEENRIHFRKLHQFFIDMKSKNTDNVSMDILSMGMTGDYETAIEEGATIVRVGTGIFGVRPLIVSGESHIRK